MFANSPYRQLEPSVGIPLLEMLAVVIPQCEAEAEMACEIRDELQEVGNALLQAQYYCLQRTEDACSTYTELTRYISSRYEEFRGALRGQSPGQAAPADPAPAD